MVCTVALTKEVCKAHCLTSWITDVYILNCDLSWEQKIIVTIILQFICIDPKALQIIIFVNKQLATIDQKTESWVMADAISDHMITDLMLMS